MLFKEIHNKLNNTINRIQFLILEADETLNSSFAEAIQKDIETGGDIMQNVWAILSKNEGHAARLDYLLDKLIKMYKGGENQQIIYQTLKNFILYSDKIIDLFAKKISYRSKVNDIESIKEFVIKTLDAGLILKGEGKGRGVIQHALDKFNPDGGIGFISYIMNDNSTIFQKILRSFMDKETSEISIDSMTGQKLGGDDEQMVRVSGGSEESDQISSESNIIWNKFTKFVAHLLKNRKQTDNVSGDQWVDLYEKFINKSGSVEILNTPKDFDEVGMLPYVTRPVFERIGEVVKGNPDLGEKTLIELIESLSFSKGDRKPFVNGIYDKDKFNSVINKMKESGVYDSNIEKMFDFLINPSKYSNTSIKDLMGKYSIKGTKTPSNVVKLRLTDVIGRTGKNGVLIDNTGNIKYTMADFVSWMNIPKAEEMNIAKKMGFKNIDDFETSNIFKKLSNKLINNLSERSNTSKEVNEIELIDEDVEMNHIDKLIDMYGNF